MKKRIAGIVLLILAAVIAVGSVTILGPCVHEDGSTGPCAKAGKAILADGCVLAVLALLILILQARGIRIGLFAAAAIASVIGILLPGTLYPLCKMDTMHCRAVMQPSMIILFAATLIVSVAGIMTAGKKNRSAGK
jgi:hypothetical protein